MNKRIRELAEQAEFSEKDLHIQDDNFQKFAELIVRECCNVLYYNEMGILMKHFGIHKHVEGKSPRPNPGDVFE